MALKTAATPVFVSALLGSPRGEAFAPSFAVRDTRMVSTMMPSRGRRSTSSTGTVQVLNGSRDHHKRRSPSADTARPRFYGEPEDFHQVQIKREQHPASAFYFMAEEEGDTSNPPPPPEAQQILGTTPIHRDASSSRDPPEPGGGKGEVDDAFQSSFDRPWRKRARDARRGTVFEDMEGSETGGRGHESGGDVTYAMRKRASEKQELVLARKESQQKAINRAAMPLVDLVGIVSPLVLIVGMTIAQNAP
ncbi:unnamed protein product [Pylaiella littoralis]